MTLTKAEKKQLDDMWVKLKMNERFDKYEEDLVKAMLELPPYPDLPEDSPEEGENHHMPLNRLRISLKRPPAMEVNRIAIGDLKLVYVICAKKKIKYPNGRSPVVYIGTTKNGIWRFARSAAVHCEEILGRHGVKSFQVRIVTCDARNGVSTRHKLERALLLEFRERYGSVPICNVAGRGFVETNEFDRFFARKRVRDILDNLAESGVAPEHVISE